MYYQRLVLPPDSLIHQIRATKQFVLVVFLFSKTLGDCMKTAQEHELITYIETPRRHCDVPVKIDKILHARMRAFMRARRVRRFTLGR